MKTSDWMVLKKLEEIERLIVAQTLAIGERFDKLERLIVKEDGYVSPELERAVKMVAIRTAIVDYKVPDTKGK